MRCASSLVGHDALGSGYDRDAETTQHAGQLVGAHIDAQAGLGHAAQAGDNLLLAGVVLQGDADGALSTVVNDLEGLDVALVQQDLSDALLHVGSGNIHGLVLGIVGVADTGEHIGNRISDVHTCSSSYFRVTGRCLLRQRGITDNLVRRPSRRRCLITSDLSPSYNITGSLAALRYVGSAERSSSACSW